MAVNVELAALRYEWLIQKAHTSPDETYRYYAKAAYFENCYDLEGELNTLPQKIYFKNQLEILKKNIIVALHELQVLAASSEKLKDFEDNVRKCDTMDCLSWQIESTLLFMDSVP